MLAGYDHLLSAARRLRWDAEAIDLAHDARPALQLPDATRRTLVTLITGFCLAERAVARELAPFIDAAARADEDPSARACFTVQADDEARHARFFERVAHEVLGLGDDAASHAPAAIAKLFTEDLPAAARALAADAARMAPAVGLYHLVLEGIVFAVGQDALAQLAHAHGLVGIADGVARVQGDERWHVGLGVLALQRLDAPVDIGESARRALSAWGPRIATPARAERVLAAHRRRLVIASARSPTAPTSRRRR